MQQTVKAIFRQIPSVCLLLSFFLSCQIPESKKQTRKLSKRVVYVLQEQEPLPPPAPNADTSYLEFVFSKYDLVNIHELDTSVRVQLRYADTNNILRRNFYDGLRNAYFTCPMAIRICSAQWFLKRIDSMLTLVVLDAARPRHIQRMMWDSISMNDKIKNSYLARPEANSLHNYGCAVDVTIMDLRTGALLDMGGEFDYFDILSRPDREKELYKDGRLSDTAYYNRRLLRHVMQRAGLKPIVSEWWHFSLYTREEAARQFALIE